MILRGQIVAALGESVSEVAARLLFHDPSVGQAVREQAHADATKAGRDPVAEVVRLLRNAKAGRALVGAFGGGDRGEERNGLTPTLPMKQAAQSLELLLAHVVANSGIRLRAADLLGEVDGGEIVKAGLLWQLAYASGLRLRGDTAGAEPSENSCPWPHPQGVIAWANNIERIVTGQGELEILFLFCLLHTFRPF